MALSRLPPIETKPGGPPEALLALARAMAVRRARIDAQSTPPANENDNKPGDGKS